MTYRIPLPVGSRQATLDIVEPNSTAVQRFLRRDGLSAYEPPTAATLLSLFEQARPGFVFFDIGANMGLYALLAACVFEPGAVHAFEPTPSTVEVLRKIVRANDADVEVIASALGAESGSALLHFSATSDASNSLVDGFKQSTGGTEVDVIALDSHVRATGIVPDVIKIDVETFEPSVLAGAVDTITRHRPAIVIEVLNRRGHDHGTEIGVAMADFDYTYYELSAQPDWTPRSAISGRPGATDHDWLLVPDALPDGFSERFDAWSTRLAACRPHRNSRVPILLSVRAAMRRGGPREVLATARRYLSST